MNKLNFQNMQSIASVVMHSEGVRARRAPYFAVGILSPIQHSLENTRGQSQERRNVNESNANTAKMEWTGSAWM